MPDSCVPLPEVSEDSRPGRRVLEDFRISASPRMTCVPDRFGLFFWRAIGGMCPGGDVDLLLRRASLSREGHVLLLVAVSTGAIAEGRGTPINVVNAGHDRRMSWALRPRTQVGRRHCGDPCPGRPHPRRPIASCKTALPCAAFRKPLPTRLPDVGRGHVWEADGGPACFYCPVCADSRVTPIRMEPPRTKQTRSLDVIRQMAEARGGVCLSAVYTGMMPREYCLR